MRIQELPDGWHRFESIGLASSGRVFRPPLVWATAAGNAAVDGQIAELKVETTELKWSLAVLESTFKQHSEEQK